MRGYIYLISFDNTNDIYIGKTINNIEKRFYKHKHDKNSAVFLYMKTNNIENAYIDIIDSIDMNEDLTHLKTREELNYYKTQLNMYELKLSTLEMFHIHNYISEGKYNIINRYIEPKYITDKKFDVFK